jgi:hypothetical protein
MNSVLKTLLILLTGCGIFSCSRQIPVSKSIPENNKTYQVDFLFEHDGCKVYRFTDHGNRVYFTNCTGDVTSLRADSTEGPTINIVRNDAKK